MSWTHGMPEAGPARRAGSTRRPPGSRKGEYVHEYICKGSRSSRPRGKPWGGRPARRKSRTSAGRPRRRDAKAPAPGRPCGIARSTRREHVRAEDKLPGPRPPNPRCAAGVHADESSAFPCRGGRSARRRTGPDWESLGRAILVHRPRVLGEFEDTGTPGAKGLVGWPRPSRPRPTAPRPGPSTPRAADCQTGKSRAASTTAA
jgi:hypothetical protein